MSCGGGPGGAGVIIDGLGCRGTAGGGRPIGGGGGGLAITACSILT